MVSEMVISGIWGGGMCQLLDERRCDFKVDRFPRQIPSHFVLEMLGKTLLHQNKQKKDLNVNNKSRPNLWQDLKVLTPNTAHLDGVSAWRRTGAWSVRIWRLSWSIVSQEFSPQLQAPRFRHRGGLHVPQRNR